MKLLSTLITTLALIASVFTAPKAMAADINIIGRNNISVEFWGESIYYDWMIDFSDDEGHRVVLDLMKDSDLGDTFEDYYDAANQPSGGHGYYNQESYCCGLYIESVYYDFSSLNIVTTGDPNDPSSVWTITGDGVLDDGKDTEVHFYCDKDGGDEPTPEPEPTSEKITISELGYATYYNPDHGITLPDADKDVPGMVGYVAYWSNGRCVLYEEYSYTHAIAAGVPVLLKAEPGEYELIYENSGNQPGNGQNRLRPSGVTEGEMHDADPDCVFYGLTYKGSDYSTAGFYYREADGAAFDFEATGKAYLALPATSGARPSIVFADEITGISNINAEKAAPAELFNIMGIRMQEAKGLVVRDGKMQFVK